MKDHRSVTFGIVTILIVCSLVVGTDILLGMVGVNRDYRLATPDRLHRKDRHLLFIERPGLDIQVPIMPNIVSDTDKREPLYYWHVKTNKWGMNDKDFTEAKPDNVKRIICLGDSCTFGWGVKRDQAYFSILQREIDQLGITTPVEVINAGHTGFSSFQGLKLMEHYIRNWDPDIVTINFGANDHLIQGAHQADKNAYLANQGPLQRLHSILEASNWFILCSRTKNKFLPAHNSMQKHKGVSVNRVSIEDFRKNLLDMISICRQIDAIPVLLTQPYTRQKLKEDPYYLSMLEISARHSVMIVDCAQTFRTYNWTSSNLQFSSNSLFIDGIHPTPEGHQLIARMIVDALKPLLLENAKSDHVC
ncbi:hypothetical protein JXQ70_01020 [bacterium]|nr:hypothetical protein [bacterium]